MSAMIAFDSHRFVKNLTACGFTEAQAEALAHEQVHLLEANLATKTDLAEVKSSLLKWMVGALTAHLAVIVAMVQFLLRTT